MSTMAKRNKPDKRDSRDSGGDEQRRGLWERIIFSFMGPPQLGDPNTPIRPSTRPAELCPKCGKPYDEHEVVRTSGFTYTRCPSSQNTA
jgi:hypothetical protein